jgi:PAS domain S-box-containing protein
LSGRDQGGTEFPINISMSHIDTGDVLLVITAVGDVTRQRQAVENAALVEAIVEYSDDGISASTLEGTITSWNPAAERMYGYSSKEIIGRSGSVLTPQDRSRRYGRSTGQDQGWPGCPSLSNQTRRKDGTVFMASVTISPIRGADGAVTGACVIAREMTGKQRHEP